MGSHSNIQSTVYGERALQLLRHENNGEGFIGLGGFRGIVAHPAFARVPFLLEAPGFERKGPDVENVQRLKTLRGGRTD